MTLTLPLPVLHGPMTVNHAALLVVLHAARAARGYRDRDATHTSGRRTRLVIGAIVKRGAGRTGLRDAERLAGNRHRSGALRGPGIRRRPVTLTVPLPVLPEPTLNFTTRRCWWCSTRRCCLSSPRPRHFHRGGGQGHGLFLARGSLNVHRRAGLRDEKVLPAIVNEPVRGVVPGSRRRRNSPCRYRCRGPG